MSERLRGLSDEELYAEIGRRRAAKRETFRQPSCQCGTCAKCKQRVYRQKRRAEGKDVA
jgi:hypothetical protein